MGQKVQLDFQAYQVRMVVLGYPEQQDSPSRLAFGAVSVLPVFVPQIVNSKLNTLMKQTLLSHFPHSYMVKDNVQEDFPSKRKLRLIKCHGLNRLLLLSQQNPIVIAQ